MKKGMKVIIYQDPITRQKKEGEAKLVHKISDNSQGEDFKLETWQVRFTGEQKLYARTIREDLNKIFSGDIK